MLRKGVLAIGEMLSRKTSTSRQVAIWALEESVDEESGVATRPPGMMIVELPFEEEVRQIGSDAALQELLMTGTSLVSPDVVNAFGAIVEKQTYDSVRIGQNFENADLTMFWDYVEHVALGLPMPAKRNDWDIIPDEAAISKLVVQEVEKVVNLLPEDVKPEKKSKRTREPVEDDSGVDWEAAYHEGALEKCKSEDIKKKLRSLGLKVSGRKSELLERLIPFLHEECDDKQN